MRTVYLVIFIIISFPIFSSGGVSSFSSVRSYTPPSRVTVSKINPSTFKVVNRPKMKINSAGQNKLSNQRVVAVNSSQSKYTTPQNNSVFPNWMYFYFWMNIFHKPSQQKVATWNKF